MSIRTKILMAAGGFGATFWLLHSAIACFYLQRPSHRFLECLATIPSPYDLLTRLLILALFVAGGLLVSRYVERLDAAEEAQKKNEERCRLLFDQNLAGVFHSTPDGRLLECNTSFARIFGYNSAAEAMRHPMVDFSWEVPYREILMKRLAGECTAGTFEIQGRHKDGNPLWLLVNFSLMHEPARGPVVQGTVLDITGRKRAEEALRESEARYRELAESIGDLFFAMDRELKYTYWNKASETLTGIPANQALRKSLYEIFPDVRGTASEALYLQVLRTQQPGTVTFEYCFRGETRFFEISAYPSRSGLSVFAKDITARKQAEQTLRKSEQRIHRLLHHHVAGMVITSPEKVFVDVNDTWCQMTGYSREELTRLTWPELTHAEDLAADETQFDRLMSGEIDQYSLEKRFIRKDGTILFTEISVSCVRHPDGSVDCILGLATDITQRKRAEEARRKSEELYRTLVTHSPTFICTHDLEGTMLSVNHAAAGALERGPGELIGKNLRDILAPDARPLLGEYLAEVRQRPTLDGLMRVVTRSGEERTWMYFNARCDLPGEPPFVIGNAVDITDLRRIERELRQSEERFRLAAAATNDIIWDYRPDTESTWRGKGVQSVLGYPYDGKVTKAEWWIERLHPEDRERVLAACARTQQTGEWEPLEYRLRRADGSWADILDRGHVIRDASGKVIRIVGAMTDLSERKRSEEAVRQALRLNQSLLDAFPCVAMLLRPGTREIVASNAAAVKVGAIPGAHCFSTWGQRQNPCPWCPAPDLWATGKAQHLEVEALGVWWDAHWIPAAGDLYMHFAFDITERKRTEEALHHEHTLLSTILETSPAAIVLVDRQGHVTFANSHAERVLGLVRSKMVGRTCNDPAWRITDYGGAPFSKEQLPFTRVMTNGKSVYDVRYAIEWPDGRRRLLSVNAAPLLNAAGQPNGVVAAIEDVTETVQMHKALRHLSGRLLRLQDEERRRIARELHDGTAQNLTALVMNLNLLLDDHEGGDLQSRKALAESLSLARRALGEIRSLSYLLHPPLLDELGLAEAIGVYTAGFSQRTGIRVDLCVSSGFPRLRSELETTIFRIVQESLSNVHRHSGSQTAAVRIRSGGGEVTLEVEDRGRGMHAAGLGAENSEVATVGVGIAGMRERARQLGGRLDIYSTAGGVTVCARLPIEEAEGDAHAHSHRG